MRNLYAALGTFRHNRRREGMKRARKGMNDLQNAAANTVSVVILIPVVLIALILGALFIGLLIEHWQGVLIAFGLLFGIPVLTALVETKRTLRTQREDEGREKLRPVRELRGALREYRQRTGESFARSIVRQLIKERRERDRRERKNAKYQALAQREREREERGREEREREKREQLERLRESLRVSAAVRANQEAERTREMLRVHAALRAIQKEEQQER
jgi:hypothetical protein